MLAEIALAGVAAAALAVYALRRRTDREPREIDHERAMALFAGPVTAGLKLAGFTVLEELGSGQMAKVLKVRDRMGGIHAMKLPMPALVANSEYLLRFAREMRLGARLAHPGVVRIEEVHDGAGCSGYPFILMEFIDGTSLHQVPNDDRQTMRLGIQALDALDSIHAAQVVHRDLTPANLMLTRAGRLKIMDFGVAHDREGSRLTAADQVLGTPSYMAPEQLLSSEPGPPADIYSIGLILYERLAGEMPFHGLPVIEVITRKMSEDVPSLALVRPDLPVSVVNVITQMVDRDAERRFQSAAHARDALQAAERETKKGPG